MPKTYSYQILFPYLKEAVATNRSKFVLQVKDTDYELVPVNCSEKHVDPEIIALLTQARNANPSSFLTMFTATEERTRKWLTQVVGKEDNRILFMLKNKSKKSYYGYMGLAFGNSERSYIEADAVVRTDKNIIRGLMKASLTRLLQWVGSDLKINNIGVRVLSDNDALAFYNKCGFIKQKTEDLYEAKDASGKVLALETNQQFVGQEKSKRSLCYMIYTRSQNQRQSG